MTKYTEDTLIKFHVGVGFSMANREETQTILQLGLTNEELVDLTDEEVEEFIEECYDIFLGNNLDAGWYVEGDN